MRPKWDVSGQFSREGLDDPVEQVELNVSARRVKEQLLYVTGPADVVDEPWQDDPKLIGRAPTLDCAERSCGLRLLRMRGAAFVDRLVGNKGSAAASASGNIATCGGPNRTSATGQRERSQAPPTRSTSPARVCGHESIVTRWTSSPSPTSCARRSAPPSPGFSFQWGGSV